MSTRFSPADELAAAAGVSLREVARRFPHWRPRLSERELSNRMRRIRQVARTGGLDSTAAELLGHLLQCPARTFLYGAAGTQESASRDCVQPAPSPEVPDVCGRIEHRRSARRRTFASLTKI